MSFAKEKFYEAINTYLVENLGIKSNKVIDIVERTEYGGYCSTCYFESVNLHITYIDYDGATQKYDHYGNFAELIEAL